MKLNFFLLFALQLSILSLIKAYFFKDQKLFIEIEGKENFGVIEENIVYDLFKSKEIDRNKSSIIIERFIPNLDNKFINFYIEGIATTIVNNFEVKLDNSTNSVLLLTNVSITQDQNYIGLSYRYDVQNILEFDENKYFANIETSAFNTDNNIKTEYHIFLANLPGDLSKKNVDFKGFKYEFGYFSKYRMIYINNLVEDQTVEDKGSKIIIANNKLRNDDSTKLNNKNDKNIKKDASDADNLDKSDISEIEKKVYKLSFSKELKNKSIQRISFNLIDFPEIANRKHYSQGGSSLTSSRPTNYGSKGGSSLTSSRPTYYGSKGGSSITQSRPTNYAYNAPPSAGFQSSTNNYPSYGSKSGYNPSSSTVYQSSIGSKFPTSSSTSITYHSNPGYPGGYGQTNTGYYPSNYNNGYYSSNYNNGDRRRTYNSGYIAEGIGGVFIILMIFLCVCVALK